ncbi:hypothetical protein EDC04DRAFT_2912411 [Pisolithus marmoratus]|nr:hypothetical protein EDC04DRAFT_2912411 [Pisolithus marmoratus]
MRDPAHDKSPALPPCFSFACMESHDTILPRLVNRHLHTQNTQHNVVQVPPQTPVAAFLIDLFQRIHEARLVHDILVEEALATLAGMSEEVHPHVERTINNCDKDIPRITVIQYPPTATDSGSDATWAPAISLGRWISYSTWRQHLKEEETWVKLQRSREDDVPLEANLLTATLSEQHAEDSVLSSRSVQIQHASNNPSDRTPQVEPHAADVDMVDVSQMSRNIDDDTHAAHEKELLSTNADPRFYPTTGTFII